MADMRNVFALAIAAVAVAAALSTPPPAHAQTADRFSFPSHIRGIVRAGGRDWTIGNPEMIASNNVVGVLPSRDFSHLLILRESRALTPATTSRTLDPNAPGELSASWWNVRTRRGREIWRHAMKPGETGSLWLGNWFAKTNAVPIMYIAGDDWYTLILRPYTGEAIEALLPPTAYPLPQPSPTVGYAALVRADGSCEKEIHFVSINGVVGDAIALPAQLYFDGWTTDGTAIRGRQYIYNADDTRTEKWFAVDPARRTVTPIPTPKLNADGYAETPPEPNPADALPLRLAWDYATKIVRVEAFPKPKADAETPKTEGGAKDAPTVPSSSVIVARDAQPGFILPDGSALVFWRDGAMYITPIVSAPVATTKPAPP